MKKYGLAIVVLLLAAGTSTATFLGFHQYTLMRQAAENANPFSAGASGGEGRIAATVNATSGLTGQGGTGASGSVSAVIAGVSSAQVALEGLGSTGGVPANLDTMQSALFSIDGVGVAGSNGTVTATGGIAGGSTADHAVVYFGTYGTGRTYNVSIYNSSGSLLGTTANGTTVDTGGTVSTSFSSGPSLTTGQTYYVAIAASGSVDIAGVSGTTTTGRALITWPTIPSTMPSEAQTFNNTMCIGIYDASNNLLIGDVTGCSTSTVVAITVDSIYYKRSGYVK